MKILSITAGAGGMYCGSCLRDNALAAELKVLGHEVTLLPLYTPTTTDERNVSEKKVFFGGISVYLQQYLPFFRKTPWILDRLWDSPWLIRAATRFSVSTDPHLLGGMTISMLRAEEGFQKKEILKLVSWLKKQDLPDVIVLPNSMLIGLAMPLKRDLRRPVICTLQGEDLFLDSLGENYRSKALALIRQGMGYVDGFVAISEYYADYMRDYLEIPVSIPVEVLPLGIRLEGYQPREKGSRNPIKIGYLARLAPEKGLHNLCSAYRLLRERGFLESARLEVAGYLGPENRDYFNQLQNQMRDSGLGDEFHYRGAVNHQEKIEYLRSLDIFSVPSSYHEPKGLYLLEAMACGVPVVQPRHGAFPEIIDKTGGGILVDSEKPEDVASGIQKLLQNPDIASELGLQGAKGVNKYFTVKQEALSAVKVYGKFLSV
jgi:glycosyltransferase involved in cell wall biosynthesis